MTKEQRDKIVDWISHLAGEIRCDWSDPRGECRLIWEACACLKEDWSGQKLEDYLDTIQAYLSEDEEGD